MDATGDVVIPPSKIRAGLDSNGIFSEGLASIQYWPTEQQLMNGFLDGVCKHGYINRSGEWVISPQFLRTEPFKNGRAKVWVYEESYETRVINQQGEFIE